MSLGDSWTETTTGSPSKLNLTTVIHGSGAYLATLDKSKHKIVICTSSGSGFTVDHAYLANNAADEWLDLSDVDEHDHYDTSGGGSYNAILRRNTHILDTGIRGISNLTADSTGLYRQSVSGTGAHTTQTDGTTAERYIEADTGGTISSTTSIHTPINLSVDFTLDSNWRCKHQIQTATSLALKTGMGMESLSASDDNNRKYGAEICTTVNSNWFAASANGTTRSSSDTGEAMTTNKRAVQAYCFPDTPKFDLHIENFVTYTKTSNIPTTSAANEPSRGAIFRYSTKNNTGASRKFNFYGARIIYATNDGSNWF
jgi:hypothetical protein